MPDLHDKAERLVSTLRSTHTSDLDTKIKISNKGSEASQTVKRIVLSRLIVADASEGLRHEKGETYSLSIDGQRFTLRFAVTAARKAIPWFNITQKELKRLSSQGTILLVAWNRAEEDAWCHQLTVFGIAPDELARSLHRNRRRLLSSMIGATLHKIQKDSSLVPGLRESLPDSATDITLKPPPASSVLVALRDELLSHFREYANSADLSDEASQVVTDLRECLETVLVHIDPDATDDDSLTVRHNKTGVALLTLERKYWTNINLTPDETDALESSYPTSIAIEEEEEPEATEPIAHPYDPSKSKIDTRQMTIDLLVKRMREDEIDTSPSFQRKAGLWTLRQKSLLIESLLIRVPLPAFYFDATDSSRWVVVDGLQRLTAFHDFILGDMRLEGLEYLVPCNGKTFQELPRALRRDVEESQVTVHLIQPGTPAEVKFNIFKRVNTGGLILSAQEIRHALNQGPVVEFLIELASSTEFLEATAHSIPRDRMVDREFVLRFLAFTLTSYNDYKVADLDAFLNAHMGRLNQEKSRYPGLRRRFHRAMTTAHAVFGRHTFRKCQYLSQPRSPVNKALFEAWSVTLGSLSDERVERVIAQRESIIQDSLLLMDDDEFVKAISQGTSDVAKVRKRFESVEAIIARATED